MNRQIRDAARTVKNLNRAAKRAGVLILRNNNIVYWLTPVLHTDEPITEADFEELKRRAGIHEITSATVKRHKDGSNSGDLDGFLGLLRTAVGEET